jgi:hypothetical protein
MHHPTASHVELNSIAEPYSGMLQQAVASQSRDPQNVLSSRGQWVLSSANVLLLALVLGALHIISQRHRDAACMPAQKLLPAKDQL